ncbi:MAG: GspE/PulE family protein [Granulosicoccus sp.]|nr:GspE/PulE family protein [Granulosicoccus sp.]
MQDATLEKLVRAAGVVSSDRLRIALAQSRNTQVSLEEVLLSNGFINRRWLCDLYARDQQVKTVNLATFIPDERAVGRLPEAVARRHCILPMQEIQESRCLCVAMTQASDIVALDAVRAVLPPQWIVDVRVGVRHEILSALDQCYGVELSIDGILAELDGDIPKLPLSESELSNNATSNGRARYAQPVVRLIDALLVDAVRRKASDIHLEPEQHYLCIRYRIDGVLQQVRSLQSAYWPAMLVRLKVLCGLNIAETRSPQDGHVSLMLEAREIDFRISTFPTLHGENLVLRLLDRQSSLVPLSQLGLPKEQLEPIAETVDAPQGLIVVTGPTGSGKTTTLYSMLNQMQSEQRNIMTLEDPVEYVLPAVRQCAVGKAIKLDFASGVRGLLRQDPDVILVGETRDRETCSTVVRAALTGHLVLTTLHSSSVLTTLYRLQDLGVHLCQLSEVLLMVVAQRLVRKLCVACRQCMPAPELPEYLWGETKQVFRPQGCTHCHGSGFSGRQVVMELLIPDTSTRAAMANESNPGLIIESSSRDFQSIEMTGLDLVRRGVTSLCEIRRVINFNPSLHSSPAYSLDSA